MRTFSLFVTALVLAAGSLGCGSSNSSSPQADSGVKHDGGGGDAGHTYVVGGTVTGLVGSGLVLRNNGGDNLAISADGAFAFDTQLANGAAYAVTIFAQPTSPTQSCTVSGGSGTISGGDVTSVVVNCATDTFTVGGTLAGLATGATVVLRNNGGDDLSLTANGTFAFATPVASGEAYAVTVHTQPTSPVQTCTVTGATGTVASANVTSVVVNCATDTFTVGGTLTGLATGATVVLQDNGGDNLSLTANGTFTFTTPVASGAAYAVTVLTQPLSPSQTCAVTSGSGTVTNAAVTSVVVNCTTNSFTVGGTVAGLATGATVVLQNNGGDDLSVTANGSFTFATAVLSGTDYAVTVLTNPTTPMQTCVVTGGNGTVGNGDVTSVTVNCSTNTYAVGGTISGLAGSVVLQNNGGDDLTVTANGDFAFATPVASGDTYAVTVLTQPSAPSQTCVVTAGTDTGTVTNAPITSVVVTCTTNSFTVGGTLTGLATGASVVLQDNGGDDLTLTADGDFTFATSVLSGTAYAVTVLTNPAVPAQTCLVSSGTGTMGGANVIDVLVTCTTNTYTVGGTLSGLATGATVVLRDNGGDDLPLTANGDFTFATAVESGQPYAVTVLTQPATPFQTCKVTNGTGTVTNANITTVTVACTSGYFVDAINGLDTNTGGVADPWKTITKAITTVPAGEADIFVLPGTYSAGETFPIAPKTGQHLIGDVANNGNGPTPTRISGGGVYNCDGGDIGNYGLTVAVGLGPASTNSSISGFSITGGQETVWICNTTVTMDHNTVFGSTDVSFVVGNGANVTISDNVLQNGNWTVLVTDVGTRLTARRNMIANPSYNAIVLGYGSTFTGGNIDLGTAADPGGNTLLGTSGGVGLVFRTSTTSVVQAAGNTWHPSVQGADASGHYAASFIDGSTAVAEVGGNNYAIDAAGAGSGIQF